MSEVRHVLIKIKNAAEEDIVEAIKSAGFTTVSSYGQIRIDGHSVAKTYGRGNAMVYLRQISSGEYDLSCMDGSQEDLEKLKNKIKAHYGMVVGLRGANEKGFKIASKKKVGKKIRVVVRQFAHG